MWRNTINYYGNLFEAKFTVLREMEDQGLQFKTYAREWEHLKGKRLLLNEAWIPGILALPYVALFIYGLYLLSTRR